MRKRIGYRLRHIFRIIFAVFVISSLFAPSVKAQIEVYPDGDAMCAGHTIQLHYNGTWGAGHRWINLGIPFISDQQTVDVRFPWAGYRLIINRGLISGVPG